MTEAAHPLEDLVRAIREAGVTDERLLQAVRATPRAAFVPAGHQAHAYHDVPLSIGHAQVTTQPSLSAMMIEGLDLNGDEHVLEVGTGLGFQTALLARLSADVVTIERWPDIAQQARRNLAGQGIRNVELRVGDGSGGVPDRAPYDAVIVSAAFPEVPAPLAEQLRSGGHLVQPIGPGGREQVMSFLRTATGLERRRVLTPAHFVRLQGRYGFPV
ncbi:protein-L-isoaspartate(D-aspartate) O-methyltransferase [Streptomyces viridosporus]|uniref:Protein-L-isoaspartate O-methyltransferase n=1 Tax=Streptomyces viridosporus (strain ATCC 14672 / DSM 40746 / JCM 4963 / KCTC 9882 / NRRL B-12104 / FH 1290) TaxID=566461 RepID=D6A5J5_STRV1|nr:protein-L-isoaspartate(D-aspartate) O-methyltransferase [Streptomyces viridosporus]EFE71707.1 L-isoaspartate(D-aspartate) O-methyltransferase [Streptomyces viridosporus ATCC 14672]